MAPITSVIGVNSNLPDGNHILMWDFDMVNKEDIIKELVDIQARFKLPRIYILQTSPKQGFHAYCFKKVDWKTCVEILAASKLIDWNYFKYGIYRKHFTLRVSPKCGREIKAIGQIASTVQDDVSPEELKSWVQYETLADSHKSRKIEVKLFARE